MKTRKTVIILLTFIFSLPLFGQESNTDNKPLRSFQLSLVPGFGTDGAESSHYRYKSSINLFAGATGGIEGFELAGFLNITNGHANGLQLSGFGNIVSGEVSGFQGSGFVNFNAGQAKAFKGAGFANFTGGSFEGFQGSGFINITGGSSQGFSGAGFANIIGSNGQGLNVSGFMNVIGGNSRGFWGAGFGNITGGNIQGFAASGFSNITGGNADGFLAAGFANVTGGGANGFQGAGFANLTKGDVNGTQFAGFMNTAHNLRGAQVSGFLNVAKSVTGLQLGFINVADTIAQGIPVGFISIVKNGGLRQLELSASDVMHLNASFRIGVPGFYNIFSYGVRPFAKERVSGLGYGVGTGFRISQNTGFQLEGHTTQLQNDWKWYGEKMDLLNELRLNLSLRTKNRLEVFAGAVLYNQVSKTSPSKGQYGADIAPGRVIHEWSHRSYHSRIWLGARAGIRMNL